MISSLTHPLPRQTTELSDVPVASDDEETLRGSGELVGRDDAEQLVSTTPSLPRPQANARQGTSDDELPSSSIESWTDDGEHVEQGRHEEAREATADSYSSTAMWSAVGSPGTYLFDENEAGPREEGEVAEAAAPQPDDELRDVQPTDEEREAHRLRVEKVDDLMSKHHPAHSSENYMTTPRKRSWSGSAVSEEKSRSARRPRRDDAGMDSAGVRLPSISELVGNPWGSSGGDEYGLRNRAPAPVYASAPRQNQPSPLSNFAYHSEANVSGMPPTLHGVSTVASDARSRISRAATEEWAGRRNLCAAKRAAPRTSQSAATAMDMDEEEEGSLIGSPGLRRARRERDRRELEELEERRRALQQTLLDHPSDKSTSRRPHQEHWRGGYAPEMIGQRRDGQPHVPKKKAVDDLDDRSQEPHGNSEEEDGEDGDAGKQPRHDRWSAVPNTKAWQYLEEQRARERRAPATGRQPPRESTYAGMQPHSVDGREVQPGADESAGGRSNAHGAENNTFWESRERDGDEDAMDYERASWTEEGAGGHYGPGFGGAIPTVVAREEAVTDMPVTVEDPQDERWAVHFDDPEALLRGQSANFIRIVWWGPKPTVVFSVYNYKYTENDEVNRHIETSVTSMTTMLTGESAFQVIPPDPERKQRLASRDLPFLWAIRGLSEAGAWEMTKVKIVTSKGVSIITHPRTLTNPRWVCSLMGFLRPDADAIRATVMGSLRSTYMLERLADLTRSSETLRHIPEARRVEYVLRSLKVKVTTTKKGAYVANLYILPPTDDMDAWREWAEELRTQRYNAFLCGAGVARPVFWCSGCRGVDHETEDCAIPKMKGWKGPEPGAGTHTRARFGEYSRGAGRENGAAHGPTRGGMHRWSGAQDEQSGWRTQPFFARGGGPQNRGNGRGQWARGRGGRGMRNPGWSPATRR